MRYLDRLRNYWRRWGLHKARADAAMWQEIAGEQTMLVRSLRAELDEVRRERDGLRVERYLHIPGVVR